MKKNTYTFDPANHTIILTKAYAKKASTPGTREFRELASLHKAYPEFTIEMRTVTMNPNKETHNGLTVKQMERHIQTFYGKEALAEFQKVKEYYKDTKGYYGKVKAWFLKKYKDYQDVDFSQKFDDQNTDSQKSEDQAPADLALAG